MTQITKRSGQAINFTWTYATANELLLDEFRLESSPLADFSSGVTVVQGGILPSSRSVSKNALGVQNSKTYYRLAAVKGTLAAYASNIVEVTIDETPPPPADFTAG